MFRNFGKTGWSADAPSLRDLAAPHKLGWPDYATTASLVVDVAPSR